MSCTHRDLFFWSTSRCFACKYHRWGLGPIETSNSDARQAVFHAESHRWFLGPIETCNFGPNEGWDQYRLVIHVLKLLFCMHKTTGEGWNTYSFFILVLSTLQFVLKTTEEVWEPYRIVSLVIKSLFCMQKPQIRVGTHRGKLFWY